MLQARWRETTDSIEITEIATLRALARAFGGKKQHLPDLPAYEQAVLNQPPEEPRLPDWMIEFQRVNAERLGLKPIEQDAEGG